MREQLGIRRGPFYSDCVSSHGYIEGWETNYLGGETGFGKVIAVNDERVACRRPQSVLHGGKSGFANLDRGRLL